MGTALTAVAAGDCNFEAPSASGVEFPVQAFGPFRAADSKGPERSLARTAFTWTDRGLLRSVLGPWPPPLPNARHLYPSDEDLSLSPEGTRPAPAAPISLEEHTSMAPRPATKFRILLFKDLLQFRHYRGLQNHV